MSAKDLRDEVDEEKKLRAQNAWSVLDILLFLLVAQDYDPPQYTHPLRTRQLHETCV
jgi:hypothetical protein